MVYVTAPNGQLLLEIADQEGLSTSELLRSIVTMYLRQVREENENR